MSTNGTPVTWRELDLVMLPLRTELAEVKADVKQLLRHAATEEGEESKERAFSARKLAVAGLVMTFLAGTLGAIATLVWLTA